MADLVRNLLPSRFYQFLCYNIIMLKNSRNIEVKFFDEGWENILQVTYKNVLNNNFLKIKDL